MLEENRHKDQAKAAIKAQQDQQIDNIEAISRMFAFEEHLAGAFYSPLS